MKAARIALILLTLVAVAAASSNSIRPEVNTVPEPDAAIVEVCAAPEAAEAPVPEEQPVDLPAVNVPETTPDPVD